jgi:shikimate kinase
VDTEEQRPAGSKHTTGEARAPGRVSLPVVLIGPVNAGKSTIAEPLAQRLGVSCSSLDRVCWGYYRDQGCDTALAREIFEREGHTAFRTYIVPFYPLAVERVLREYPHSVIDLGAGHTVFDNPDLFTEVRRALAPHPNIVLLLPSPDPDESIRILSERRSNPMPEVVALNEYFVRHHSNSSLAKIIVYTKGKTPEETCDEIVERLVPAIAS